jgi:hypothetical protein
MTTMIVSQVTEAPAVVKSIAAALSILVNSQTMQLKNIRRYLMWMCYLRLLSTAINVQIPVILNDTFSYEGCKGSIVC